MKRAWEISNKTPLSRSSGKVNLCCAMCGIVFERYAAWAKKASTHYCGRGCSNEAKKIKVDTSCVNCGKSFQVIPSCLDRIVTCSRKCRQLHRTKHPEKARSRVDAKKHIAKIAESATHCEKCKGVFGPETREVEGLNISIGDDGVTPIISGVPIVVCRPCHMSNIAHLGPVARDRDKPKKDNP